MWHECANLFADGATDGIAEHGTYTFAELKLSVTGLPSVKDFVTNEF
jgi:hypothetical protein